VNFDSAAVAVATALLPVDELVVAEEPLDAGAAVELLELDEPQAARATVATSAAITAGHWRRPSRPCL
jgi:hypothetical protein